MEKTKTKLIGTHVNEEEKGTTERARLEIAFKSERVVEARAPRLSEESGEAP